jgi:cytochrome c-type biogenesis protein
MTNTSTTQSSQSHSWLLYTGMLALLIAIVVGGYFIFRLFAIRVMPDLSAYNLLALSVIAGFASFFSPCAFPLLPGYFSVYYSGVQQDEQSANSKPSTLKLGLAAAAGIVSFNLILGLIIGLLGAGVAQGLSITGDNPTFIRFFRGGVGIVLLILGFAQLREVNLKPIIADALAWRTRPRPNGKQYPVRTLYLYGFGYNAAGMGCTGPILAGLVVFALSSGGWVSAFSAFLVFSITMGSLMLLVSALVATSQKTMIHRLKSATPRIKKTSSILLVFVGLFNIITSISLTTFVQVLFP